MNSSRVPFLCLLICLSTIFLSPTFTYGQEKKIRVASDTIKSKIRRDTSFVKTNLDTLAIGESKSGYSDIERAGGVNTVSADLVLDDVKKDAWTDIQVDETVFNEYYNFKRFIKKKTNVALGTDYMFLYQWASFSFTDRQAASGIFRFYGTWRVPTKTQSNDASLTFKIENRHKIGTAELPRNLGYSAGGALSTASFKDFQWGLTNLYWKQHFGKGKYSVVGGIIDPGDWLDLYPLLNPFKFYLSEAFFNSPAMALPNQGLGFAFAVKEVFNEFYLAGGLQDANGEPTKWIGQNFESFINNHEYMFWIEGGWNPNPDMMLTDGQTIHLMYWHQAARIAERDPGDEVQESWGFNFSASKIFANKYTAFLRAGYAVGNGATMHHLIHGGFSYKIIRHDVIGFGAHWGGPNDRTRPNQTGLEVFYALQLTDNLNIMPDIQLTFNPSFNDERNVIGVYSVFRIRYAM
jgi:porin